MKRVKFAVNITSHVTAVTIFSLLGNVVVDSSQLRTGAGEGFWRVGRCSRFHWRVVVTLVTSFFVYRVFVCHEFGPNRAPFRCHGWTLGFRNFVNSGHCCDGGKKVGHGTCQRWLVICQCHDNLFPAVNQCNLGIQSTAELFWIQRSHLQTLQTSHVFSHTIMFTQRKGQNKTLKI